MVSGDFKKWLRASPDESVAKAARRALRERLAAVQFHFTQAAEHADEDIEHVHQLRVWARRATAAMELFRPVLPKSRARRLRKQLRRVRRVANDARDHDTFTQRLAAEWPAEFTAELRAELAAERAAAQQPINELFARLIASGRWERRSKRLIRRVGKRGGRQSFGRWVRKRLRPAVRVFLAASEADFTAADVKALHQFRISAKKLRYELELCRAAVPREACESLCEGISQLQDRLGLVNDYAVGIERLTAWLSRATPAVQASLTALLEQHRSGLIRQTREFADWWNADRKAELHRQCAALLK